MAEGTTAVVGAGMAGLACARALGAAGRPVVVLEKSRGLGGRCATRRREGLKADHGSPYAEVRDPGFAATVAEWRAAGLAAPWPAAGPDRVVGTPGMNTLAKPLAEGLDIRFDTQASALEGAPGAWRLRAGEAVIEADRVVLAIPAPQAVALLGARAEAFPGLSAVTMDPCWTVIAGFDERLAVAADMIEGDHAPLKLALRNTAKPDRPAAPETWVLHAGAGWTAARLGMERTRVAAALTATLAGTTGIAVPAPATVMVHSWLYARVATPLGRPCAWDADLGLGLAGDWCEGPGLEAAWVSGTRLAAAMLAG